MRIARTLDGVTVLAPAKINLFLELLSKRPDGFHDLETLFVAVDLCDTVRVRLRRDEKIVLATRWALPGRIAADLGDVPTDENNIVVRAMEKLRAIKHGLRGVDIELTKRIPSAAGLGGASSDAAAALVAGNALWRLGLTPHELGTFAAELGSDVPFFLGPPVAIGRGRGERLEPVSGVSPLDVVIVRPPVGLSTPAVYRACQVPARPESVTPLVAAWQRGDYRQLAERMTNRLETPARSLSTWIERLRAAFAEQGCWAFQMSGSGSSYFGIARHAAHARRVAQRLRARRWGHVICTRTLTGSTAATGGVIAA